MKDNKIKLLAIDDEEQFLVTLSKRLTLRGFEVDTASDGYKALEYIDNRKYDIALLDLKMPGINGFDVLKSLKRKHQFIEVIIITAHGSVEAAFDVAKLGAFDILFKPFELDTLIIKIFLAYEKRMIYKVGDDIDTFNELIAKANSLPLGSENALDYLNQLKEYDDGEK